MERRTLRKPRLLAHDETIEKDDPPVEMDTGIVAHGRTVEAPIPGKRKFVGYDRDTGQKVYGPVYQTFGPNKTVMLPKDEIIRLRILGFLIDPDKIHRTQAEMAAAQAAPTKEPRTNVNYSRNGHDGAVVSRA